MLKGDAKMKAFIIIIGILLIVSFVGCATLPLESNLQKPVAMTQISNSRGNDFVVTKHALWLFWGLISVSVPNVDEIIGPRVADYEGVQNLKITTQYGFVDFLLSAVTSGVIYSQTVTIQGKVY